MLDKQKKREWIAPLTILIGLNLILLLFDLLSWTLNFKEGTFIERVLNAKLFTEWFTPYSTPEFNILALLLLIIYLPEIIIPLIGYIKDKNQ